MGSVGYQERGAHRARRAIGAPIGFAYRPAIDGVRAVAALLVVVFHAGAPVLTHGYVGVDVFFVLSGYLITSLLIRETQATGRLDVAAFYARRVRRLLPMSLTVLLVTALAYRLVATPLEVAQVRGGFLAAAGYVANWYFLAQSQDYFAQEHSPNPMLHYWSLSAEEQFYVAWPLLLLALVLLTSRRGRRLAFVIAGLAAAGVVYAGITASVYPMLSYFGTVARAYQLLAGALVALLVFRWDGGYGAVSDPRGSGRGQLLSALGLGLVIASATRLGGESALWHGLMAVAGVVLLLVGLELTPSSWVARALSRPPMRTLGDLSYSIYLWHWPVVVIGDRAGLLPAAWLPRLVVVLVVTLGLASLGMLLVERPGRRISVATVTRRRRVALAGPVAALVTVGLVLVILPVSPTVAALQAATDPAPDAAVNETLVDYAGSDDPDAPTILVVGDSHARMWLRSLASVADDQGWRLVGVRRNRCPWPEVDRRDGSVGGDAVRDFCSDLRERALAVAEHERPDLTVLATRALVGGSSAIRTSGGDVVTPADPAWRQEVEVGSRAFLSSVARWSTRVAIVEPIPETESPMSECLSTGAEGGVCDLPAREAPGARQAEAVWRALAVPGRVAAVDLDDLICPQGTCPAVMDGVVTHSDTNHLTDDFAVALAPELLTALRASGVLPGG